MTEADRHDLLSLLTRKSFEEREVVLSSGARSNFYIDSKQVTLDAVGHVLIGRLLFEQVVAYERRCGRRVDGVGGLTLGADPIASAVSLTSALEGHPIPAFIVRKSPKAHGTEAYIEGARNIASGGLVIVLEDVVTTGGSAATAIERVRAAGYETNLVLGLVDRLEGGREHLASLGVDLVALFDRRDFLPDLRTS